MSTKLIIARHGTTFGPGDTPTRIGSRTDLELVENGRNQARALGRYLAKAQLVPDVVYSARLKRSHRTAELALEELGLSIPIEVSSHFDEIDYGEDENRPEPEVVARIGKEAINEWNRAAIVPPGWVVDPNQIIKQWFDFAKVIRKECFGKTVLVVTSNGIARFAPHLTGDFEKFKDNHTIKIATGAVCHFEHSENSVGDNWDVVEWGLRPEEWLKA